MLNEYLEIYKNNPELLKSIVEENRRPVEHEKMFDDSFSVTDMVKQAKAGRVNYVFFNREIVPLSGKALTELKFLYGRPINENQMKKLIEYTKGKV